MASLGTGGAACGDGGDLTTPVGTESHRGAEVRVELMGLRTYITSLAQLDTVKESLWVVGEGMWMGQVD